MRISLTATGSTPFNRLQCFYRKWDDYTPRLMEAMSAALREMDTAGRTS
jgi:hypothetical protein